MSGRGHPLYDTKETWLAPSDPLATVPPPPAPRSSGSAVNAAAELVTALPHPAGGQHATRSYLFRFRQKCFELSFQRIAPLHLETVERLAAWLAMLGVRNDRAAPLFPAARTSRGQGRDGFKALPMTIQAIQKLIGPLCCRPWPRPERDRVPAAGDGPDDSQGAGIGHHRPPGLRRPRRPEDNADLHPVARSHYKYNCLYVEMTMPWQHGNYLVQNLCAVVSRMPKIPYAINSSA